MECAECCMLNVLCQYLSASSWLGTAELRQACLERSSLRWGKWVTLLGNFELVVRACGPSDVCCCYPFLSHNHAGSQEG